MNQTNDDRNTNIVIRELARLQMLGQVDQARRLSAITGIALDDRRVQEQRWSFLGMATTPRHMGHT